MEDITSSSQIHEYSLKGTFLLGFLFCFLSCLAQNQLHTSDKKAIKLYEKSDEQFKVREFEKGIASLKGAIKRDPEFAEAYLKLAGVYNFLRVNDSAFNNYQRYYEVVPKSDIQPRVARGLAARYFRRGKYPQAAEVFNYFLLAQKGKPLATNDSLLLKSINFSLAVTDRPKERIISRLSDSINRYALQYFPVLTIDQQTMVYTKRNGLGIQFDEDIVIAQKMNGSWSAARGIDLAINTEFNEGACSISADGRTLIFTSCEGRRSFGSCDLYYAVRTGDQWSQPKNLGKTVNSPSWDSQPSLSADGKTLYFSSNRPGGRGKRDIWVTREIDGQWSKPSNLGSKVNTPQDETTPYIHVNGESLFFSSEGHVGLGGFDIYVTEREETGWSHPENLGYAINDFEDQSGLFITADGKKAFYTDESGIKSEIYTFPVETDTLISQKTSYLTGVITDSLTKEPIEAKIELYDLETQERLYHTASDPVSGRYFLALNEGGEFGAYVNCQGYLFEDFRFDLQSTSDISPDTIDVALRPLNKGATIVLENVYFNLNSYELLEKSKSELELAFQFLDKNQQIKVEIAGHTDTSGSAEYNLDLSERRAKSVYDYLLAKGISEDQMIYKGYGAEFPISRNNNTVEYSKDRRIEFRILSTLFK